MNFDLLKAALADAAKNMNVEEYEMYYTASSETSVSGLNNELNAFSLGSSAGVCVRVLHNGKMGYAASELFEEAEMQNLLERAIENAENTEKEDENGLFHGSNSYDAPRMKSCTPYETAELKALTVDIMKECYASSEKVTSGTSATAVSASITVGILNSHGLDLENTCAVNLAVAQSVVNDKDEIQADFVIKSYDETTNSKDMAKEATEGALAKIGAGLVESGKYDVIISGSNMRSILSAFTPAFSAKSAQMGISLLAGKEGEKIADDCVTIFDEPMREGSTVGTPFDAEGVATHRKSVVEKGVLKTLLHNRETAKRAGVESTANASKPSYSSPVGISPYCFYIEAGDLSEEELYKKADNAILITEVKGLHAGADAVTGDFSIESAGFMIKDGKRAEAVKSFTIAGNFFELLKNIVALSNEVKFSAAQGFTYFGSPDVLVKGMSVAGK